MISKKITQLTVAFAMTVLMVQLVAAITPSQIDGQLFDTDNTTLMPGETVNVYIDSNGNGEPDDGLYDSVVTMDLLDDAKDGYFRAVILPENFIIGETDVILVVEIANMTGYLYVKNIEEGTSFNNDVFLKNETIQEILSTCGNSIIEGGESCDGTNFGGKTCSSYGYNRGTLSCTSGCTISTVNCYNQRSSGGGSSSSSVSFSEPEDDNETSNETITAQQSSSTSSTCKPNWGCSDWSECVDGVQKRVCADKNNCRTEEGKPSEQQECVLQTDSENKEFGSSLATGQVFGGPLTTPNITISILVILVLLGGIGYFAYMRFYKK